MKKNIDRKRMRNFLRLTLVCAALIYACSDSKEMQSKPVVQIKIQDTWVLGEGMQGLWVQDPGKRPGHQMNLTAEQKEEIDKLHTIGYLSGYKPPPARSGVMLNDPARSFQGLNLSVSGHKPEAVLMDMNGIVIHRWSYRYDDIENALKVKKNFLKHTWRRAHVFENGDLLAIYEGFGLLKLDRFSNFAWYYPGRAHHDLYVAPEGEIYVLTRQAKMIPRLNKEKAILEDFITRLSADGKELEKISLIECFENSPFAQMAAPNYKLGGDIFHTNTIERITQSFEDRHQAFRPGNFLISIRNLNAIAIVDPDKKQIVWAKQGIWKTQHEPQLLANGNILLFDNTGHQSFSRVIEYNPFRDVVEWEYAGHPPESFFSRFCGTVQRLPNDNTLITDTCSGRAFEVTKDEKKIAWEYVNPHRAGSNNELIAALLNVIRLKPNFPIDWLTAKHAESKK